MDIVCGDLPRGEEDMLGVEEEIFLVPPRFRPAEGGREEVGVSRGPLDGVLGRDRGELDDGVRGD